MVNQTKYICAWGSPVLFKRKKDGGFRLRIHYRAWNNRKIKNHVPLPMTDEKYDQVSGIKYFSTIDLR